IAGVMPEAIIDRLEVVNIDHQEGQRSTIALRAIPFAIGQRQEVATIINSCHAVHRCKALKLFSVAYNVRDVAIGQHPSATWKNRALAAQYSAAAKALINGCWIS